MYSHIGNHSQSLKKWAHNGEWSGHARNGQTAVAAWLTRSNFEWCLHLALSEIRWSCHPGENATRSSSKLIADRKSKLPIIIRGTVNVANAAGVLWKFYFSQGHRQRRQLDSRLTVHK